MLTSVILLAAGAYLSIYQPVNIPLKQDLKLFPYALNGWEGSDVSPNTAYKEMFETDFKLSREYRLKNNAALRFYVGYLEAQEQGKELVNYKSEKLHNGAAEIAINTPLGGNVTVNRVIKDDETIFFWYDLNGRIVANRNLAKVYTTLDALKGKTNGAVVIVSAEEYASGDQRSPSQGIDFVREMIPALRQFLP